MQWSWLSAFQETGMVRHLMVQWQKLKASHRNNNTLDTICAIGYVKTHCSDAIPDCSDSGPGCFVWCLCIFLWDYVINLGRLLRVFAGLQHWHLIWCAETRPTTWADYSSSQWTWTGRTKLVSNWVMLSDALPACEGVSHITVSSGGV